jgi:SAM-dependent methyltransferase
MAQTTSGLRSLLSLAFAYRLFQGMVGAPRTRRALAEEYIRAAPGERVLDIGCGTAEILEYLPDVDYVGFDQNPRYIESARRRHAGRGTFFDRSVKDASTGEIGTFDKVLALGILHHLDDAEVRDLFGLAKSRLKPGGRLITFDSCYREGQSRIAKFFIDRDRGRNTRTEPAYTALAAEAFPSVRSAVREDLLRIPYTHIILVCSA